MVFEENARLILRNRNSFRRILEFEFPMKFVKIKFRGLKNKNHLAKICSDLRVCSLIAQLTL